MADRVVLTIGTKKGVFVAEAAKPRRRFALRGPSGAGVPVYATLIDARGAPRLYASSCNPFFGMKVLRSTDLGKSFKETKSKRRRPRARQHLVVRGRRRQAGAVVRGRARGALQEPRRRRFVGAGPGHQQSRALAEMAAGQRRALPAHDHPRRQPRASRHLDRRPAGAGASRRSDHPRGLPADRGFEPGRASSGRFRRPARDRPTGSPGRRERTIRRRQ